MAVETFVATLAAVLGAGFASGREVWVFFGVHGHSAALLGVLAALLLAAAAWQTAQRAARGPDPLAALFGSYRSTGQLALSLFSLLTFAAVLAVLGSLAHAYWHVGRAPASLAAAAAAAGLGAAGPHRQRRFQGILLLTVVVCGTAASLLALSRPAAPLQIRDLHWQAVLGVFGFVAYNIALATDGIARSATLGDRRSALGAAFGGLIAGLLLTLESTALVRHGALVARADLPLVVLAASIHGALGALVAATVLMAGLSAASSFAVGAGSLGGGPWVSAAAAFALSLFGVQGIVDRGYPLMAAVAGVWLILLFMGPPRRRITLIRWGGGDTHSAKGR
ncbi:MAG: hypothetical protein M0Z66_13760 [Thermaerobacter sp.]|nr:hypothetical protein [Thermaerobacter sp.]